MAEEQARLEQAGAVYATAHAERELPALPERGDALRRERAPRDRPGEGAHRGAATDLPARHGARGHLRPCPVDPRLGRDAARRAARGDRDRRPGGRRLPAAPALLARRSADASRGGAGLFRADVPARSDHEHHVARRHHHRDRRHRRRRGAADRGRASAARGGWTRRRSRARDPRLRQATGQADVRLAPRAHDLVPAHPGARGAGGPALQAARLHEDLLDGVRRGAVDDARPCADDPVRARTDPARIREPAESRLDGALPPGARRRLATPAHLPRRMRAGGARHRADLRAAGLRVHAARSTRAAFSSCP
jgi:hypothetical protein